jgi:hypothetical protein
MPRLLSEMSMGQTSVLEQGYARPTLDSARYSAEDGYEEKALLYSASGRQLSAGNGILDVARLHVK